MEGNEDGVLLSAACALPLPQEDEDEDSDFESWSQDESEVEAFLVFDETTQICTSCDQVLENPSYGPLCNACHAFLYPDYTDRQRELDEARSRNREDEGQPANPPNVQVLVNPRVPLPSPGLRSAKRRGNASGTVNKLYGSSASDESCSMVTGSLPDSTADDELIGLALLSLYDEDWILSDSKLFKEKESVIEDDLVENMPTESK